MSHSTPRDGGVPSLSSVGNEIGLEPAILFFFRRRLMMKSIQNLGLGTSLRMKALAGDLRSDERGVTAVEYAVMLVLVAIVIIVGTPGISDAVMSVFSDTATFLTAASPA
jgi:Flp pilus assembly pilin Flp